MKQRERRMLTKTVTAGQAFDAFAVLRAMGEQRGRSIGFRLKVGLNAKAMENVVGPIDLLRQSAVKAHSPEPDAKWDQAKQSQEDQAKEAEWREIRAKPVEVQVPGLKWEWIDEEDQKLPFGGDVLAAVIWMVEGVPDDLREFLRG